MKLLYLNEASELRPHYADAQAAILEFELMQVYGGREQYLAAPAYHTQRMLLVLSAKHQAEKELADRNQPQQK